MPERIYGDVNLAVVLLLGSAVARSAVAFRSGLHRAPIEDGYRRLWLAPARYAKKFAQVVSGEPPGCALACHPAQAVEGLALRIIALRRVLSYQGQVRGDKGPFVIGYVNQAILVTRDGRYGGSASSKRLNPWLIFFNGRLI